MSTAPALFSTFGGSRTSCPGGLVRMLGSAKASFASLGKCSLELLAPDTGLRERSPFADLGEQVLDAGEQPLAAILLGLSVEAGIHAIWAYFSGAM